MEKKRGNPQVVQAGSLFRYPACQRNDRYAVLLRKPGDT